MVFTTFILLLCAAESVIAKIDRKALVERFSPQRTASGSSTPLQVGNGDFAFGGDITGLQTFLPFNTLTSWCWHNSSLPTTPNQTQPSDFTGLDWFTHGRLVNYEQPNPAEADISTWMIQNPHRVNVGRVGLWFGGNKVDESDLEDKRQILHLYNGSIESSFSWQGANVHMTVGAHPDSSTIAVKIQSSLTRDGAIGVFLDYPYASGNKKFEAPFVGVWNATANHTTSVVEQSSQRAQIEHILDATAYYTTIVWEQDASLSREDSTAHRYILKPNGSDVLFFAVSWHPNPGQPRFRNPNRPETSTHDTLESVDDIQASSNTYWHDFWEQGAFVNLLGSRENATAIELQRRIVQSLYILAVNGAGFDPPQESGLVNNGWYGKFHAEMFLWNLGHWARWDRWDLSHRSIPGIYERSMATSVERARRQGYTKGARWGKMLDSSGRSAPGEINSLVIWQQPHPMYFAELEWRSFPCNKTLAKWDKILFETADFMAEYAFWNASTGVYDLGPPMYPMSENTNPNNTRNAAFELAYWRFGLDVALKWQARQGKHAPKKWRHVLNHLAPLPQVDGLYVIYEGIPDMWHNSTYTEDHQSMLGLFGWLPPPTATTTAGFNFSVMQATVEEVYKTWNFSFSFGWDFPMMAMNAARMGDVEKAVEFLVHPSFQFDDAGYQVGGERVATPYNPGAGSLLWAVAMMAAGWDGEKGAHFPDDWNVEVEGFQPAM